MINEHSSTGCLNRQAVHVNSGPVIGHAPFLDGHVEGPLMPVRNFNEEITHSFHERLLLQEKSEESQKANYFSLGSFKCLIDIPYPDVAQCFLSSAYKYAPPHSEWPPYLSTKHKCDLAQAKYSEQEITELTNNWGSLCAKCLQWGHKKISCSARVICINCSAPGHKTAECNLQTRTRLVMSSEPGNQINQYPLKKVVSNITVQPTKRSGSVRCEACGFYGHLAKSCFKLRREKLWKWIPKISPPSHSASDASVATSPRQTPELSATPAMANYPLNPIPFLPQGWAVEPGPADRLVRSGMVVNPIPPLNHDFLVIAKANRFVPHHRRAALRDTIEGLLHEA